MVIKDSIRTDIKCCHCSLRVSLATNEHESPSWNRVSVYIQLARWAQASEPQIWPSVWQITLDWTERSISFELHDIIFTRTHELMLIWSNAEVLPPPSKTRDGMSIRGGYILLYCDSLSKSGTTPNNEVLQKFDATNRHKRVSAHAHTAETTCSLKQESLSIASLPAISSTVHFWLVWRWWSSRQNPPHPPHTHTHTCSISPFFLFICFLTWMNWIGRVGPWCCPLGQNGLSGQTKLKKIPIITQVDCKFRQRVTFRFDCITDMSIYCILHRWLWRTKDKSRSLETCSHTVKHLAQTIHHLTLGTA